MNVFLSCWMVIRIVRCSFWRPTDRADADGRRRRRPRPPLAFPFSSRRACVSPLKKHLYSAYHVPGPPANNLHNFCASWKGDINTFGRELRESRFKNCGNPMNCILYLSDPVSIGRIRQQPTCLPLSLPLSKKGERTHLPTEGRRTDTFQLGCSND